MCVLLKSPQDIERSDKVTGIRTNFACTFHEDKVPINQVKKADGNGAYLYKGNPKRLYFFNDNQCVSCHFDRDQEKYFINERINSRYQRKYVLSDYVFELQRTYHQSKLNPTFLRMMAFIRPVDQDNHIPYYFLSYQWTDGVEKEFLVGRHGNAKHPHAPTYFRQTNQIKKKAEERLEAGHSSGKVYRDLIKDAKVLKEKSKLCHAQ